ncbi:MAG: zinc ABC transporter substrate-binding protein, partial [Propionibacteriaceae bacterium]|nr:zinc ABC transporter substrate-binding protein [Propionibacteriaceae bacterium]
IAEADLVIYQSGFQAAVDEAIATAAPKHVIDLSANLDLLEGVAHDHDDEAEHAEETGAHEEEPGHEEEHGKDPHTWLSPAYMLTMAADASAAIVKVAPDQEAAQRTNLTALSNELSQLGTDFEIGLANCERRGFVTTHAAFAYLAKDYGLQQIPLSGLDPTVEPTAARLAEVQNIVKQNQITTIFFEVLTSDAVAKSLAKDLGLRTDVLDPIEGITDKSAGKDYLEVMRANLDALRRANSCQ